MNLQELASEVGAGHIRELDLVSLAGGIYLLQARLDGKLMTLQDEHGESLRLRSTTHAREVLEHLPPLTCHLVQQVVHDEMCGLRDGEIEPLRLPFSSRSAW